MASIQIQLAATNALTKDGDSITITMADGSGWTFQSFGEFQSFLLNGLDAATTGNTLHAVAFTHLLALDPALDSPSIWNGKTFILDPETTNPANLLRKI